MKKSNVADFFSVLMLVAGIIAAPLLYARFPFQVPIHWDAAGNVNGYSSGFLGAFLLPIINVVVFAILTYMPRIDPRRIRYQEFSAAYSIFKEMIVALFLIIYVMTSVVALGYILPVSTIVPALIGFFIMGLGVFLPQVKNNWLVGIRTPWTLSDETVWDMTHALAGKVFIICGVLLVPTAFLPLPWNIAVMIVIFAFLVIVPTVYSFTLYRSRHRTG